MLRVNSVVRFIGMKCSQFSGSTVTGVPVLLRQRIELGMIVLLPTLAFSGHLMKTLIQHILNL